MSKSRKSLKSRLFCGLTSAALVVSNALPSGLIGASAAGKVDLGTFKSATADSLGSANSYAVFSKTYNQDNHMEGVFATERFFSSGQGFGTTGNVKNYINLGENYIYIGGFGNASELGDIWAYIEPDDQGGDRERDPSAVEGVHEGINNVDNAFKWSMILPDSVEFDYSTNNGHGVTLVDPESGSKSGNFNNRDRLAKNLYHISETTYQIDFDAALDALNAYSKAAFQKDTKGTLTDVSIDGDVITITCSQGPNYISLTSDQIAAHELQIVGASDVPDGEAIKDNNDQSVNLKDYSLVINVKDVPEITDMPDATAGVLYNKKITVDNQGGGYSPQGGQVMFNLYGVTSQVTFQECNTGVILAPQAGITVTASHNGSIFAHDVTNTGCQIHQNPFRAAAAPKDNSPSSETSGPAKPADFFVEFTKVDQAGDPVKGATLQLTGRYANGNEITDFTNNSRNSFGEGATVINAEGKNITWITGTTAASILLKPGTYTLTETAAPNGYEIADPIEFKIDTDGIITIDGKTVYSIEMIDETAEPQPELKDIKISKQAAGGGNELPGAHLTLADSKGNVIADWTSGSSAKVIAGSDLEFGETYTLTETGAPNGYAYTEAIKFRIDENGDVYLLPDDTKVTNRTVVMKDNAIGSVQISKNDINGTDELPGAKLTVYLKSDVNFTTENSGHVTVTPKSGKSYIETWVSGTDQYNHLIDVSKLVAGETYVLVEETAPNGYTVAEYIEFKINDNGSVTSNALEGGVIRMKDEPIKNIEISKVAAGGGSEIGGAELVLTDSKGGEIDSWTSAEGETHTIPGSKLKVGEEYTLTETGAPDGYTYADKITFTIDEKGNVLRDGKIVDDRTVQMVDEAIGDIEISKVAVGAGTEIEGAKLTIADKDGKLIDSWTSAAGESHTVRGTKFKVGEEYTLTETTAPNGYTIAESITFKIDENGDVLVNGQKVDDRTVLMVDGLESIKISKTDINGTTEVSGATLTLYLAKDIDEIKIDEEDGKANVILKDGKTYIASWVSADEPYEIGGDLLLAGETYILVEEGAPEGYAYAEFIEFTMNVDGSISRYDNEPVKDRTIVMKDEAIVNDPSAIHISKVAAGAGNEIPGAHLTLTYKDDNGETVEVDSWISGSRPHTIEGSELKAGVTYTLTETGAPNGYTYAEDITFSIDEDGNVLDEDGNVVDNRTIKMVDDAIGDIEISKVAVGGGSEIGGAHLTLTDSKGNPVDEWDSVEGETHTIDGTKFKVGEEYTLTETGAPDGYAYADSIKFKIEDDGSITRLDGEDVDGRTIEMIDEAIGDIEISKVAAGGGSEVPGAHLTLTDSEGNVVDEWTSGSEAHTINGSKLKADETYTLTETGAPNGYAYAEDITFSIDRDGNVLDEDGEIIDSRKIKMEDGLIKTVQISKYDINGTNEIPGATLTVYLKGDTTPIDSWVSGNVNDGGHPHLIDVSLLTAGKTYVLVEEGAPQGYTYTEQIEFTINEDGTVSSAALEGGVIKMKDDVIKSVKISKTAVGGGNELDGATLTVYLKDDIDGEITVDEDGKANVTLKDGKEAVETWTSGTTVHEIDGSKFIAGKTYVLVEEGAPEGYAYAEYIEFTIGKDGSVLDEDGKVVDSRTIKMEDDLLDDEDDDSSSETDSSSEESSSEASSSETDSSSEKDSSSETSSSEADSSSEKDSSSETSSSETDSSSQQDSSSESSSSETESSSQQDSSSETSSSEAESSSQQDSSSESSSSEAESSSQQDSSSETSSSEADSSSNGGVGGDDSEDSSSQQDSSSETSSSETDSSSEQDSSSETSSSEADSSSNGDVGGDDSEDSSSEADSSSEDSSSNTSSGTGVGGNETDESSSNSSSGGTGGNTTDDSSSNASSSTGSSSQGGTGGTGGSATGGAQTANPATGSAASAATALILGASLFVIAKKKKNED